MSDTYQINLTIPKEVGDKLLKEKKVLYAFKAVKGPGDGKPLVWMKPNYTAESSNITWTVNYGAYFSETEISAAIRYNTAGKVPVNLGDEAVIDSSGVISAIKGSVPGSVTVMDNYKKITPLTFGLGSYKDAEKKIFDQFCAFPIDFGDAGIVTPIQKVALMFAKDTIQTATAIERSIGPGILIDLTDKLTRNISFDDTGDDPLKFWTSEDGVNSDEPFTADSAMNPLLIKPEINDGKLSKKILAK